MTSIRKKVVISILVAVVLTVIILLVVRTRMYQSYMTKEDNLLMFEAQGATSEIYILGTIHGAHFEESSNYSLADIQSAIDVIEPDILLVEARQETFDNHGVIDGPFEMIFAWSYAEAGGIPVRGIDWWRITEDAQSNTTTAERDDHIYENITAESAGYEKVLVLCGATHRIEQRKRFSDNGHDEKKLSGKSDYFNTVSPESFTYPKTLRAHLEDKAEWSKTVILEEITAGTAEGGEARQQWLQNAANLVASIERMQNELVDANSLFYSE